MEWISTKDRDRLPAFNEDVLVTVRVPGVEPYVDIASRWEVATVKDGWIWTDWDEDFDPEEITGWAPLPAPAQF